jgi:hypothetical protein
MKLAACFVAFGAGCGTLSGFGGDVPPLATVNVQVTGDFGAVKLPGADNPNLHVSLVWGAQWLTEALCILPPDDASVAALIAAGCRDPFSFVPDRVAADVPLEPDGPTQLVLFDLPAADVMVGDVTARVAYGSLVIYDDRNGNGTLDLDRPHRLNGREEGPPEPDYVGTTDITYGTSFVSMTEPDTRLAFREGGFNAAAAFYPRAGCGDPLPSFSIVSAGGFSVADAIAATMRGELPPEDPATCSEATPDTLVAIALRKPAEIQEVRCEERRTDSSIRYREPPADPFDLTARTAACAKVADFGTGTANGAVQFVVSGRTDDACIGMTHYVLRGCRQDATCEIPDWDLTATPPTWWPCPVAAAR